MVGGRFVSNAKKDRRNITQSKPASMTITTASPIEKRNVWEIMGVKYSSNKTIKNAHVRYVTKNHAVTKRKYLTCEGFAKNAIITPSNISRNEIVTSGNHATCIGSASAVSGKQNKTAIIIVACFISDLIFILF